MSETLTNNISQVETVENRPNEKIIDGSQLVSNFFDVAPPPKHVIEPEAKPKIEPESKLPENKTEEKPIVESSEEIVDADNWLKTKWGWENEAAADNEIKQLRELKEKKPEEIKFENEQSKHIHELLRSGKTKEVLDFLDKHERINQFVNGEINNNNAEDVIKLSMKLKYGNLTDSEINYKYNKQYGLPKEPTQETDELDEDFAQRKESWQNQVNDINMSRMIDAKLALPELEKSKSQIVLPEIEKPQIPIQQLTQEELDAVQKYNEAYLKSVDDSIKGLKGFSVKIKNEGVGLSETDISYAITENEKVSLMDDLKNFVNKNYDANDLFADQWVNKDLTLNVGKIAEDRYLLANKDKIFQKIADDAASKAIESFLKGKKQINIKETHVQQVTDLLKDNKTELDHIRDSFFG